MSADFIEVSREYGSSRPASSPQPSRAMTDQQQQQQQPGSIRQRSRKACAPCKKRKKKCNGDFPCKTCVEFEYECTYEDASPAEHLPSSSSAPLPARTNTAVVPAKRTASDAFSSDDTCRRGMLEPSKNRYYPTSSAIAFPRSVALAVQSSRAPRLHSFAYNLGIATEPRAPTPRRRMADLISYEDALVYSKQYFSSVNSVFNVLDEESYHEEMKMVWDRGRNAEPVLEALACYVILLSSIFYYELTEYDALVAHSEELLRMENLQCKANPDRMSLHRAWILRTIFYRCTSRPLQVCVSSSIALQQMEQAGLHREISRLGRSGVAAVELREVDRENRRRLFWITWLLNRMVTLEISRSATFISGIDVDLPAPDSGPTLDAILAYRRVFPDGTHQHRDDYSECLLEIAALASRKAGKSLVLDLMHAELACALFRQLYDRGDQPDAATLEAFRTTVTVGLDAAAKLRTERTAWWMLANMPFQVLSIALAVGKPAVLELLPQAVAALQDLKSCCNTHMTREAFETAQALIDINIHAKERDLQLVKDSRAQDLPSNESGMDGLTEEAWASMFDTNLSYDIFGVLDMGEF